MRRGFAQGVFAREDDTDLLRKSTDGSPAKASTGRLVLKF